MSIGFFSHIRHPIRLVLLTPMTSNERSCIKSSSFSLKMDTKAFIDSYLAYRQTKQVLHSKAILRDFLIPEMSHWTIEPVRFNSTTFARRLDMLDHIVS